MYWQQETDPDTHEDVNTLHVFGRTFHTPHIYYYRRLLNNSEWTPWEKVPVDIQGDHLIPVIWNRRLYLFWPIFTQKARRDKSSGSEAVFLIDGEGKNVPEQRDDTNGDDFGGDDSHGSGGIQVGGGPQGETPLTKQSLEEVLTSQTHPPQRYWEISLAWSEYKQNKWSPKHVAKQVLRLESTSKTSGHQSTWRSRFSGSSLRRVPLTCSTKSIASIGMLSRPTQTANLEIS